MLRNFLFCMPGFLCWLCALPQPPAAASLYFEKFTTQNKLSHNKVNCILQDRRGFMWIGTNDGLNRFDGNNFLVFRNQPGNKASLSGNIITGLLEDKEGVLWIATEDGGLSKYDYRLSPKEQFTQFKHLPGDSSSLPTNTIHAIEMDNRGFIWLATSSNSVIRLDIKTKQFSSPLPKESKRTALDLETDNKGWLWAGRQGGGILKINTTTLEQSWDKRYDDLYARLPHVVVTSLFRDKNGIMWYGSWDKVLYRFDPVSQTESALPANGNTAESVNDEMLSFAADAKNRIWMGGRDAGLHIYDPATKTFQHYVHNPLQEGSVADNTINCVYIDQSGKVWLGTNKGLSVSNPAREQFAQFFLPRRHSQTLIVYDFFSDEKNTLWIGTSEGLFLQQAGQTGYIQKQMQFGGQSLAVTKFYKNSDGAFYIGTNYSLFRFDPASFSLSLLPNTESDKVMNKIIESRVVSITDYSIGGKPVLLVSPYGHYLAYYDFSKSQWVSRLNTEQNIIEQFNLKDNLVHKFYKTSSGQLWQANAKEGLGKWELKNGKPHLHFFKNDPRKTSSLGNNHVYDIAEDRKGNLWISTYGGGLHYMDTKTETIRHIPQTNNLLEGIQTDSEGRVWMISNGNLYRYDPVKSLHQSYSIPDLEKSGGLSGYMYKDAAGYLYAAGKNYYTRFHPDSVGDDNRQPEVYLTDFRIFNESFSDLLTQKSIRLNYRQNYFTIEFAAPDYLSAQPVQYAYMLEGNDKDWVECGTRNFAPYSNLREGTYTFRVKATNNPGAWSEKEFRIKIIIIPPVWRRWWFFVLCALLIAGAVYAVYRYRINELLKRQAIRNKIAQDLHDSVGSTLSSISVYSQVAHIQNEGGNKDELNEILDKISHTSTDMISEMNDIVWAINPRNDSVEKIIQRMESFAKPLLAARNISFRFNYDKAILSTNLEMEKRKNFYLIFKEAVTNVIKYSGASLLEVDIQIRSQQLQLTVKDNGVGFNPQKEMSGQSLSLSGNGLRNMHSRAKELKGQLAIRSAPGQGTEVWLQVPLS